MTRKLADVYGMQGRLPESLHLQRLALGYAEASGDLVGETDALLGIAQAAVLMGDDLPVGLLDRVEKLVRIAGPRAPHEDPELVLAFVDTMRGDARTAADRLERLYRQALEHGTGTACRRVRRRSPGRGRPGSGVRDGGGRGR
ncbi:MAG: hypothetical protein AUI14_24640 [Actinobacteria bacterium 13_2_20CM_2_71_6]|nr:MAG: hypothetical protein AUI14_24640 [Actinobacteria bacterium 13_2_20CM_2_71_6]